MSDPLQQALLEQLQASNELVATLADSLNTAFEAINSLRAQSDATAYALTIVMREFRDRKQLDVHDMAEDVIRYTREVLGENAERDDLVRGILVGKMPQPKSRPPLALIPGGRDGSAGEPQSDG